MLSKSMYSNPLKQTTANNSLYKGFWDEQAKLRTDILNSGLELEKSNISELDRYKQDQIKRVEDEVKEYERTHGHSGNFFTDFKFGVKSANDKFIKPFNKYAAPVISKLGPVGTAIGATTNQVSGIVEKLQ